MSCQQQPKLELRLSIVRLAVCQIAPETDRGGIIAQRQVTLGDFQGVGNCLLGGKPAQRGHGFPLAQGGRLIAGLLVGISQSQHASEGKSLGGRASQTGGGRLSALQIFHGCLRVTGLQSLHTGALP